jgi:hypothetical protein
MSKASNNLRRRQIRPPTEVRLKFKVILSETHWRTGTKCDEHSQTFAFSLEHDFETVSSWLNSDTAQLVFDDLCGEIGHYLDVESGGSR